jgi:hypothetical protein
MLIRQPIPASDEQLAAARVKARVKGGPIGDALYVATLEEGRSAQLMHHGPYAAEHSSIVRLHQFIAAEGLRPRGKHHEIYLSDPRRTSPDRMRTVLRQPVEPAR